jgi:hypothetical protein
MDMDAYLPLFVGDAFPRYRKKWLMMRQWGGTASWNWAGFLFTIAWLGYRRMFRPALYCIAASGLASIADLLLDTSGLLSGLVTLGTCIVIGLLGNSWYRRDAETRIHEIVATRNRDDVPAEIVRQGGTDLGAAFGFFLLEAVVIGVIGAIAGLLS